MSCADGRHDERFTDEQLELWANWAPEPAGVEPANPPPPQPARAAGQIHTDVIRDIADYQPTNRQENTMTEQQKTQAETHAVRSLHHCGNPEQDHLIDEIQHPETEEALYEMPARLGSRSV